MASVVRQDFPKSDYEIVVVDNGSTGDVATITQAFQKQATVRYIREQRIGLCIARNTGWQAAAGRYIAFLDDDAIARPGWLQAIRDAFACAPETIGAVGGRVDPIWEGERPVWLADEIAGSLTIIDWGRRQKIIQDIRREWLVGANMAMPKTLLAEVGGFHPWLDRVGEKLLSSGDVFLQKEIRRHGYNCLYVPEMVIEHLVPLSRLRKGWFIKRFYWQGVSDAVMHLIERTPVPTVRLRLALARALALMRSPKLLASLLPSGTASETFKAQCFTLIDIGFIAGLLGAAKH
jgi:glycosyltransferase involved in cell wall biosynthesis